ncbi:MAG: cytochrome C, partial [Alphaproteobacteria bacterium]|nr:cytochrome C [Alphaproteobacteria bacterium]
MRRWITAAVIIVILTTAAYALLLPGLSVARQEPSALEVRVATWLLHASVPAAEKNKVNPLNAQPDAANIRAGHD